MNDSPMIPKTGRTAGRFTGRYANRFAGRYTGKFAGKYAGRFAGRFASVLIPFLILCLGAMLLSGCARQGNRDADPLGTQITLYKTGLFSAPSSANGSLLLSIPAGAPVEVISYDGPWAYVRYSELNGYVYRSFLGPVGSTAVAPPSPAAADLALETVEEQPTEEDAGIDVASDTGNASSGPIHPEAETAAAYPTAEQPERDDLASPIIPPLLTDAGTANADPSPAVAASPDPAAPASEAAPQPNASPIRLLSVEELDSIAAQYDGSIKGYGSNGERDEFNCPVQIRTYQQEMSPFNVLNIGDTSRKVIYLTFPMGWENGTNTMQILDILHSRGVPATFYVTHAYADANPDIIRRIIAEGHDIGSHGYAHPADGIASWPLWDQQNDSIKMQQYMQDTYGYTMHKYNFSSSYWSQQSLALMNAMGYHICFYSFNYTDYDVSRQLPPDEVLQMLIGALFPGCIYYLHTTSDSNVSVLADFIDTARSLGYEFGSI